MAGLRNHARGAHGHPELNGCAARGAEIQIPSTQWGSQVFRREEVTLFLRMK
jgi:hypothetical protein